MMEELHTSYHHPFHPTRGITGRPATPRSDWEDWEDDEPVTPIDDGDEPLIEASRASPIQASSKQATPKTIPSRVSNAKRQSIQRVARLRSRKRLRGQNANLGIKLDTDVANYRQQRPPQPVQMSQPTGASEPSRGKFVDAAALKALEGSPSTATVGSFHWLWKMSKGKGKAMGIEMTPTPTAAPVDEGWSPQASTLGNKITIGIELPEGTEQTISPQTALIETPQEFPIMLSPPLDRQQHPLQPLQPQVSVWSPDTEYTNSAYPSSAGASSLRSQPFSPERQGDIPPVPSIPADAPYRGRRRTTLIEDDIDLTTPVTLFEEGSPIAPQKPLKVLPSKTPISASRSHGWWDQILSPFVTSPEAMSAEESSRQEEDWWKDTDQKSRAQEPSLATRRQTELSIVPPREAEKRSLAIVTEESEISPTVASSSASIQQQRQNEHPVDVIEKAQPSAVPSEAPPPYSPPERKQRVPPVRYRAVFPPGHELNAIYPPSPGPPSAAMTGTMTSQGGTNMTEVPLTPPPVGTMPLPPRPVGSFVPGDHFLADLGRGDRQKAEKRRRRHEREDYLARRAGGFWRGRWCIPATGCFGRSGREGRKRRRVCCGIFMGVIGLITLAVVLGVVLTKHHPQEAAVYSPWLNLTNFPPMPTGISTVVGEDNTIVNQACANPPTLWQCTLPKEQASEAAPFSPEQPKFIFQIQFDNSSNQAWNITGQQPPVSRRDLRKYASGFRFRQRDTLPTSSFQPNPPPPTFQEMFFLGNTTDNIQSPEKAGEPTPFYISLLSSVNCTVGPNALSRRQAASDGSMPPNYFNTTNFPVPDLNPNKTGAPARLIPHPIQQPLRLYDRGLPTEHYGFYTYFNKTIYLKSVSSLNSSTITQGQVPADVSGGSLETEANFLVIWVSTRFKIEIFTRLSPNATRFVGGHPLDTPFGSVGNDTRPGSFPYPVAVTVDTHGGDRVHKGTWAYRVNDRQEIDTVDFLLVANNQGVDGTVVNPAGTGDASLGGFDGGHGGCECGWRNYVGTNGGD